MRIKKIMAYLIVVLLIVKSPIIAYAESTPGTITVEGGSIGSGGIEGNSNVLKGTALTILMTTLASVGMQVKVFADDYSHGVGAFAYLEDKFNEWEQASDNAWDLYEDYKALNQTKVNEDGSLYIPEMASNIMQKFVNWLYANEDVSDFVQGDSSLGVGGNYYGETYYVSNDNYFTLNGVQGNFACVQVSKYNSKLNLFAFSKQSFTMTHQTGNLSVYMPATLTDSGWYVSYFNSSSHYLSNAGQLLNITSLGYMGIDGIYQYLNGLPSVPDTNISNTGFYTENSDIPSLVDVSGNGKILIVQPGLIGQVQDEYIGANNSTISIQDYLDALSDLYGQQALPQEITDLPDITITGEDAITGTKEEVAVIDRDLVLVPDITVPADPGAITWPEVPETAVAVADPSNPADPDVSIPAMSLDLTEYFPFCLPFDIYHILQKLNADPVTPEVTVDWGDILGTFGIDYVMHLDLHDYDDLAELLRNMETAAFVVGLAVVTRQMFLRG